MANQLELEQRPFIELQIEALVQENQIKQKRVNKFVEVLRSKLIGIDKKDYEKRLNGRQKLPMIGRPNSFGQDYPEHFKFLPPRQIKVIGGIRTSSAIKRISCVDLAICMPVECLDKRDIKNQKYHAKRALYLAQLATLLSRYETGNSTETLIQKMDFRYYQGDFMKPVLLIVPKDLKLRQDTVFQIFVCPDSEAPFKTNMLAPEHGNVAPKWFFKDYQFSTPPEGDLTVFISGDSDKCASPFYNSGILFDLEMLTNSDIIVEHIEPYQSLKEALLLLKIWLLQRDLHHHFSFILSMYLAHLQANQIVHQNMSAYQVFKLAMKSLASLDWAAAGLSFYHDSTKDIPSYKSYFPLVFCSPSGKLNLCYNITSDFYERLRHEVDCTLKILAKNSQDTFEYLFLRKVNFETKFDVIVHIPKCTRKLPMKQDYLKTFLDRGTLAPVVYSAKILELVKEGMQDRAILIQQSTEHLLLKRRWNYRCSAYNPCSKEHTFTLGLLLDQERSLRILDIGPDAQSNEAERFRSFWEPKSQLRLQNGVISETVVWHVKSFSQRRAIIKFILTQSLKHAEVSRLLVHYTTLERFIGLKNVYFEWKDNVKSEEQIKLNGSKRNKMIDSVEPIGIGEEIFQRALKSYNELNKVIRSLDNLKYAVTSVHPMSPTLRSCSVFPPMPVCLQAFSKSLKRKRGVSTFPEDYDDTGKILHVEPIEILLSLETTGKWPNDFDTLQAAKLDFLIQMGEALKDKEYCVKFSQKYLDVLHGQFVFRIHLKCPKELMLSAPNRPKQDLHKLKLALEIAPRVNAALDQLYREKPAFSLTCRLVKRWISCHLMTDHINDLTVELIVAHLFLHPEPYSEPSSSLCGFRRFMLLMSDYDWQNLPLIVNFDEQLKLDEINRIKNSLQEDRTKFPPMVISTPYDKDTSPWTRNEPTLPMLELLRGICGKAAEFIKKDILFNQDLTDECKALFRPNFKLFNLIIKLNPKKVQNSFMGIDAPKTFSLHGREPTRSGPSGLQVMPIVGLNIIECYVKALRQEYDKVALFFYDKYGQRVIGVVLKEESEKILGGDLGRFKAGIKELGAKLVESINIVKHDECES